jgi:hypothetical protein
MKPTRTWLVIADGARARILEDDGADHRLHKVKGHEYMGDHLARHDQVSDRQGRSFNCHARISRRSRPIPIRTANSRRRLRMI